MEISQGNSLLAILDKQKCLFFFLTKTESKSAEQILTGDWYQWEGVGCGERV
jgi:hypothetical protein